jgi:single-strand DNA-binding protein
MNQVVLKGNVGQDPKITTFDDGGKVVQFSLATTERGYKKADGTEIPDKTDWHNLVVKRKGLAGVCEQYVKKGTAVLVVGKLKSREYTGDDGQKRYITEVVVEELELCGGGQKRDAPPPPEPEDDLPWDM